MVDPNLDLNIKKYVFGLAKDLDISRDVGEFFEDSELIALIRNCPIIYDRTLPDYKSEVKKAFFWNAIAEVFGVDKDFVTSRWVNLRCYFARHRSNLEKHHIPELSFLDPFVISRNRLSNQELDSPGMLSILIESVKKRPELYMKKNLIEVAAGDVDIDTKIKNSWIQVSNETGFPVDNCQKKWHYLREMYSRTKKQQAKGMGKTFQYFDELAFLKTHIKQRSRHGIGKCSSSSSFSSSKRKLENLTFPTTPSNNTVVPNQLYFNGLRELRPKPEFVDPSNKTPVSNLIVFDDQREPKTEFINTSNDSFEEHQDTNESFVLSDSESQSSSNMETSVLGANSVTSKTNSTKDNSRPRPSPEEDEDDKFGRAIAADLKNIPFSKKKLKLKANIYKLLCEAIEDDDS